jgi:4-alpha-glucanotransferase
MEDIADLAAEWGVAAEYCDAFGHRHGVPQEALSRIVDAIAGPRSAPRRLLPGTIVVRRNRGSRIDMSVHGQARIVSWAVLSGERVVASGSADSSGIVLPDVPVGTYAIRTTAATARGEVDEAATLLVAPETTFQGDGARSWALAVQLYGVRSHRNWGHGDFTDLADLIALAGELGAAAIALNPLHALFHDRPERASPYAPNSRLFLNPLYIDVGAVPEFPGVREAGLDGEIARLRGQDFVDYGGVAAAKLRGLRLAYDRFRENGSDSRRSELAAFRKEHGDSLVRFASFEVLRRRFPDVWWEWPEEWRRPVDDRLRALRREADREIGFFEFVQWNADAQLAQCREQVRRLGLPIGLYLDVAVGVEAGGADAWSEQDAILNTLSIGAPPDPLNTAGQDWGLSGFSPSGLEARQFAPFRRMLGAAMRHAGAIRLDHVLGLRRLFVIAHGMKPQEGTYLQCPFEPLLAVIAQESRRHKCIVIGEDLGTVPENFRESIADWGLWSYLVMLFERAGDGSFHPPEHYKTNALATFNTHDLPTFAGWVGGHDLRVKRDLGIDPGETDDERGHALHALRTALQSHAGSSMAFSAVAKYLAATPSRLVAVSLEDALGLIDQPNLPGTTDEHANWRRRLPVPLEDLQTDARLHALAATMQAQGRRNPGWTDGAAEVAP